MPARKDEHKPRRRKSYSSADWSGRRTKTRGVFSIFNNVKLFYVVGALIMAVSFTPLGLKFAGSSSSNANSTPVPTPTQEATTNPEGTPAVVRRYTDAPPLGLIDGVQYFAVLHTSKGDIRVQLDAKAAPQAVNSFIFLAKAGFYSDLPWLRVIPDFVAQSGDPSAKGAGTAGYTLPDENNNATFAAGTFALARRAGVENSASSQFFITLTDQPRIEGTAIGTVVSGMDVAKSLTPDDPQSPVDNPDMVTSIDIEGDWNAPPTPTPQATATPQDTPTAEATVPSFATSEPSTAAAEPSTPEVTPTPGG